MITIKIWRKFKEEWNDLRNSTKYITQSFIVKVFETLIAIVLDIILLPLEAVYLVLYGLFDNIR